MQNKKIRRLIALDLQRKIGEKIWLAIEIVLCTIFLIIAFSGVFGINRVNSVYKKLDGVYVDNFMLTGVSQEETNLIEQKILQENVVGNIDIFSMTMDRENNFRVYGYNDVMLEKFPLQLSEGSAFSDTTQDEYNEIVLTSEFKKQFKIGQKLTDIDFGIQGEKKYKVVGFLKKDFGVLDSGYSYKNKNLGIVRSKSECGLSRSIVFSEKSVENFLNKYDLAKYILKDEANGVSALMVYTVQQWKENTLESYKQILSFFVMFFVIAMGVYLSTIISSVVIRYNDNLLFNKNMVRIGTTKKEFLLVKTVTITIISIVCIVLSSVIGVCAVAPNIVELLEYSSIGVWECVCANVVILGIYAILEIIEVCLTQRHFKKERL